MPLLADINGVTGSGTPCDLFAAPLALLRSAADSILQMRDNPPAGIQELTQNIQTTQPPAINKSQEIGSGLTALQGSLPASPSALTGGVSGAMDTYFNDVNTNLAGPASEAFGPFKGISAVANLGIAESIGNSTGFMAMLQNAIDAIPDPLTVVDLLTFLRDILTRMPHGFVPLKEIPLLDELRDKLDTALRWQEMDGTQIVGHVAGTFTSLNNHIRTKFIGQGPEGLGDRLNSLGQNIDDAVITTAFNELHTAMTAVAAMVNNGDLSAAGPHIATLNERHGHLKAALLKVNQRIVAGEGTRLVSDIRALPTQLEENLYDLIALLNPPMIVDVLGWAFSKINEAVENIESGLVVAQIGLFLQSIRDALNSLNLNAIKDTLLGIIQTAVDGIHTLRDMILQITVEFNALMEQVRSAIQSIGISDLAEQMQAGLQSFNDQVVASANSVFQPVKNILLQSLQALGNVLDSLDPEAIIETLQGILSQFTNLLSNPQLIDAINQVKEAINEVNGELKDFTFKPGTDIVIEGIGQAENALKKAAKLKIPDALKTPIKMALEAIPVTLDGPIDSLMDKFDEMVDGEVMPFLETIKSGPKMVVEIVQQYSPQRLIGDCLSAGFQSMVTELDRFKPSDLLTPVQQAIDFLKEQLMNFADPAGLLAPLQGPFESLLNLIDQFDPMVILGPIEAQLQAGIHFITDHLPISPINDIFDAIQMVGDGLESARDTLQNLKDMGEELQTKLSGLNNAEGQIEDFGTAIAAKIDLVSNIAPVTTAMDSLGDTLADIHKTPLLAILQPDVQAMATRLTTLDAKAKLVRLAADNLDFPRTALGLMPDSLHKEMLQTFLNSLNPVAPAFASPVDYLDTWGSQLQGAYTDCADGLADWDTTALVPAGPVMQLHTPIADAQALQTLLKDTLQQQLTDSLKPVFKTIDYLRGAVDGVLTHVNGFLGDIETVVQDLLDVTNALEEIRVAANELLDLLNNFSLGFVADEIEATFDVVKDELMTISPARIGEILSQSFEGLLDVLDVKQLLGAAALDEEYHNILESLREFDPGKIIVEALRPTWEALIELLKLLDITEQVDGFEEAIDHLRDELRAELQRCGDAFEKMWKAVPASLGSGGGASVSASVSI
jgi:uncharacterized phage infection (PIP) family protein YhgE